MLSFKKTITYLIIIALERVVYLFFQMTVICRALKGVFSSSSGDAEQQFPSVCWVPTERGTERTFVNFEQLAHRVREKRKKRKEVYIC